MLRKLFVGCAWFLAAAAFLVLGACSTVQLAYNNLESLVAWYADDYFDFNSEQEAAFKSRLVEFKEWHRANELPVYATFLRETKGRLADGLTADDFSWATQAMRGKSLTLLARAAAETAPVLATLSDEQLKHLRQQFDEANEKFTEEYLASQGDKRIKERVKRTEKRFKAWLGDLEDAQWQRVAAMVRQTPDTAALRLVEHKRQQEEFMALLADRRDARELARKMKAWVEASQERRSPEYARQLAKNERNLEALLLELDRTLTAEQREFLNARLTSYADEFSTLHNHAVKRLASAN